MYQLQKYFFDTNYYFPICRGFAARIVWSFFAQSQMNRYVSREKKCDQVHLEVAIFFFSRKVKSIRSNVATLF